MESWLNIIGVGLIIISIVTGLKSNSALAFFIILIAGISFAIIFFALSVILENQSYIVYRIDKIEDERKKLYNTAMKVCKNCNSEYEQDYSSCPRCGYRD